MKGILRRLISALAVVALVASLVGVGFCACVLPVTTQSLANMFANDAASPFDRTQLVQVADATRDYAFGSHSKLALYQAIYEVDAQYADSIEAAQGKLPADFPDLDAVSGGAQGAQGAQSAQGAQGAQERAYERAFARASDKYCLSEDEIAHLDDCFAVFQGALPVLVVAFVLAIGGLIAVGILGKKRHLGGVLRAGGAGLVVLLVLLALWAAADFNGFFASFHALLFAEGNWSFPSDSLLICALPQPFWAGMGVVWLAVSLVAAGVCVMVGMLLRHGK